ncbi:MAG: hypothetical protein ACR2GX_05385 [Candidatus Dormibacteria bacterium]
MAHTPQPSAPLEAFLEALQQVISDWSIPYGNTIPASVDIFVPLMSSEAMAALHESAAAAAGRGEAQSAFRTVEHEGRQIGHSVHVDGSIQMLRQLMETWQDLARVEVVNSPWSETDTAVATTFNIDLTRTHGRELDG